MTTPSTEPAQWREGVDGSHEYYREVLRPGKGAWAALIGLALMLGAAYFAALGPIAGVISAAVLMAIGGFWFSRLRAVVRVDDRVLRAGKARLPLAYVGRVRALDQEQSAVARSSGADAHAFLVLRVGYAKTSVAVEVADPRDPHTYWLISTRHPQQLVSAIMEATSSAGATTTG
jgi:hypothetical protein